MASTVAWFAEELPLDEPADLLDIQIPRWSSLTVALGARFAMIRATTKAFTAARLRRRSSCLLLRVGRGYTGGMDDIAPTTSLWLVPAEPLRAILRSHIDDLAVTLGTPAFDPHVTLVSGIVESRTTSRAVERMAAAWAPLDVVAGPTGHGPDRFKTLFVEIDDPHVRDLAAALAGELDMVFDPLALRAHVSLAYATGLPADGRARLAEAHRFEGQTLRFDTLAASVPGEGIDDVARWQLTVARRLRGPGAST